MMEDYSVAVIGCGKRGRRHAGAYAADPRCRITALVDVERDAAEECAGEHGPDAAIYADHREMLAKEEPDVASVCLWTGLHLPVFRDCVDAGVRAVFCEKPMAPTWGESLQMARLAREHAVQLTFCHQRRFHPGNQKLREWIREGRFGEIRRIDMYSPRGLLDCGTHSLDQAGMFNMDAPIEWVMGQIDARELPLHYGIPREHVALGYVRWDNGVRGVLEVGEDRELPTGLRILGTGGFIEVSWNGEYGQSAVFEYPDWTPPQYERVNAVAEAVQDNVDCLESGREPELSVEKAVRATEAIFAIFESSRSRARIELPLETTDSALESMIEAGEIGPQAAPPAEQECGDN